MGTAGLALDGVAIYNSLAGPGDDTEEELFTFDRYNAHPSPDGTYHYHTTSQGPLEVLASYGMISEPIPGQAEIEIYGLM